MIFSLYKTSVDWDFYAKPSNACKFAGNRGCYMSRAKMLGGCSSHNHMIYVRAPKADFDYWAEMCNPDWNWDGVLP